MASPVAQACDPDEDSLELQDYGSDVRKQLDEEFANESTLQKESREDSLEGARSIPREHMRVYLRVRPLTDNEVNKGENQVSILLVKRNTCYVV